MDRAVSVFIFVVVHLYAANAFNCPNSDGVFASKDDPKCVTYWVCDNGVAQSGSCPQETMFYPNAEKCVEASELVCVGVPVLQKKLHRMRREKGSSKDSDDEHHEEEHHEDKSSSHSSSDESHKERKEKIHSSSSDKKYKKHEKDHKDITSTSDHNTESDDSHIEYEKHYYHKEYFPVPIPTAAAAVPGFLGGGFPFAGNMQFRGNTAARYQNQPIARQQQLSLPPGGSYDYYMPQYNDYDYGYGYQSNDVYQPRYNDGYQKKDQLPPQTHERPTETSTTKSDSRKDKTDNTPPAGQRVFGQFGARPMKEPLRQPPSVSTVREVETERPRASFSNHDRVLAPYLSREDDSGPKPGLHMFGLL